MKIDESKYREKGEVDGIPVKEWSGRGKNRKEGFSFLTPEEIEEIASKEWKKPTIYANNEVDAKRVKNLTGPKTKEGKMRSLQNLRPAPRTGSGKGLVHGGYVHALLSEDEVALYEERKEKYLKDFDLNESSDEALLRAVLLEEVIWYRLMKKKAEKPSLNLDRPLNDCMKRLRDAMKALGVTREQRQGVNVNIRASIADLADRIHRELHINNEELKRLEEEEEMLMREKELREQELIIEGEYEILDETFRKAEEITKEKFGEVEEEDE